MQPAARQGDEHKCSDIGPNEGASLKIEEGSPNIEINGRPAARVGDKVSCRMAVLESPVIAEGSSTVTFNGKPAARAGDRIQKGGSVTTGSPNMMIGDGGGRVTIGIGIK